MACVRIRDVVFNNRSIWVWRVIPAIKRPVLTTVSAEEAFSATTSTPCHARGNFGVDIARKNDTLVETKISSAKGGQSLVRANGKILTIHLAPNEAITIKP